MAQGALLALRSGTTPSPLSGTMFAMCWTILALTAAGADAQSLRGSSPSGNSTVSSKDADRVVNSSNISALLDLQEQAEDAENYPSDTGDMAESQTAENVTHDLLWPLNTSKPSVMDTSAGALNTTLTVGANSSFDIVCWGCTEAVSFVAEG